jgi:ATP-dependent RNA helicase RhlE
MSFDQFNLDSRLMPGIKAEGYVTPTPVQSASIPLILAGHDMIGTAQTGTGKTAAFVLPILHKLLSGPRNKSRALILTPTRELAEQIHEAIRSLGKGTGLRSATIYGGVPPMAQIRALRSGFEILVACPGRLLDHMDQRHADLSNIEFLVLDEADRMLDMGFLPSVRKILQKVPAQRQTLLFSATFPDEIESLARQSMRQPQRVTLGLSKPVQTVSHALYPVLPHLKLPLLLALLQRTETDSVLIFARTRHRAQRVAQQVGRHGYKVTSLHSDRTQSQRQAALQGFRRGEFQIMVATDIAARGLDVESISHVINFDMPDTADAYIHRIGRTGRAERSGDAYTMTTPEDTAMVKALEKIMGKPLPRQTLQDFDYKVAAPDPAQFAERPQQPRSQTQRAQQQGSRRESTYGNHSSHPASGRRQTASSDGAYRGDARRESSRTGSNRQASGGGRTSGDGVYRGDPRREAVRRDGSGNASRRSQSSPSRRSTMSGSRTGRTHASAAPAPGRSLWQSLRHTIGFGE